MSLIFTKKIYGFWQRTSFNLEMVGRIIPQLVLDLENEDLIWVCSLEEELLTVFSINSNSAPILFGFIKG